MGKSQRGKLYASLAVSITVATDKLEKVCQQDGHFLTVLDVRAIVRNEAWDDQQGQEASWEHGARDNAEQQLPAVSVGA